MEGLLGAKGTNFRIPATTWPARDTPTQRPVSPPEPKQSEKSKPQAPVRLAYTVKQLAAELGLSPVTIRRLEARRLIKSVPGIRHRIYSHAEVQRFLAGDRAK
jgi:hypothetical protein